MADNGFSVDVAAITIRRMMEEVLAEEEEHVNDLLDLLGT